MFNYIRKAAAMRFQSLVYSSLREWMIEKNLKSVLDVGCGCPEKLKWFIFPVSSDVTGMDRENEEDFREYSMKYVKADLENSQTDLHRVFDAIVCADVLEHIKNVANVFGLIKRHANQDTFVVLSTPDVDSVDDTKIKSNDEHVHAWNKDAFTFLLDYHGFDVISSELVKEFVGKNYYNSHICLCKLKEVN